MGESPCRTTFAQFTDAADVYEDHLGWSSFDYVRGKLVVVDLRIPVRSSFRCLRVDLLPRMQNRRRDAYLYLLSVGCSICSRSAALSALDRLLYLVSIGCPICSRSAALSALDRLLYLLSISCSICSRSAALSSLDRLLYLLSVGWF